MLLVQKKRRCAVLLILTRCQHIGVINFDQAAEKFQSLKANRRITTVNVYELYVCVCVQSHW
jgi:hypothetical protein